jgi:hypothetical protein
MNVMQIPRIETSQEDKQALLERELTPMQIVEKISFTIQQAEKIFADTKNHKVSLEEGIQVTLPRGRARGWVNCKLCSHVTNAPGSYKIKNEAAKAKIVFDDHTLHQLKEHLYFGVGQHWVDPVTACKIYGL